MKYLALLLCLILTACSGEGEHPTRAPTATQPAIAREVDLLSEPAAETRHPGKLYTLNDMSRLAPIAEVAVVPGVNAGWAEKNGSGRITPGNLELLLVTAVPIAPGDRVLDAWSYAPWCGATFASGGRRWSVALYLGGLGVIRDDLGRGGAFRFEVPAAAAKPPTRWFAAARTITRSRGHRRDLGRPHASEAEYAVWRKQEGVW